MPLGHRDRMARVLAYPFALGPDGTVNTVDDTSDEFRQQQLVVAIATRPGERVMQPTFGIINPAWVGLDPADVQAHLDVFGPRECVIVGFVETTETDLVTADQILWSRGEQ